MAVLQTRIDPSSAEFRANRDHNLQLVADLRARLARTRSGDAEAVRRHRSRGKLLARERIDRLVDPGTPFLEFSPLAANGMYDDDAPAEGIITGIGSVQGKDVAI